MTTITPEDRARRIKIIIFDVDGVLTDGSIFIFPEYSSEHSGDVREGRQDGTVPSSAKMIEAKAFSAHDGIGISLARLAGIQCGIITKRISEAVAMRARDLRIEHVYLGQSHKMRAVREIMEKGPFMLEEIAYAGDDVIDLPVMRQCGLAIAVANAREQVKSAAHFVTPHAGGYGAGRDAIEFILNAKSILSETIEKYINDRTTMSAFVDIGKGGN